MSWADAGFDSRAHQSLGVKAHCLARNHGLGASRLVLSTNEDGHLLLLQHVERRRCEGELFGRHDLDERLGRDRGGLGHLRLLLLLVGRRLDGGRLGTLWWHTLW